MLLTILVFIWIISLMLYLKNGHYLFSLFLTLFGLYEFTGPVLYSGIFGEDLIQVQQLLIGNATDEAMSLFTRVILLFFILVNLSYLFYSKVHPEENCSYSPWADNHPEYFNFIVLFMFVCGVISVNAGAGAVRIMDYTGEELPTTPFYSYGAALLVVVAAIAVYYAIHKKWLMIFIIALATAPLAHELFIASRRQYFAPSILFVMLLILYSKQIKAKLRFVLSLTLVSLVFFGIQYWLRYEFTEGIGATGAFEGTIAPQLGEFIGIGSTTFTAWDTIIQGSFPITFGSHWLFQLLNSIPFVKIGSSLFPDYGNQLFDTYHMLAPFGGLSILADAILGFGFTGAVIIALLAGVVMRYWHGILKRYLSTGFNLSIKGVYSVSLISTLVLKYRSGLGDMIHLTIDLTILYFFAIFVGVLFHKCVHLKNNKMIPDKAQKANRLKQASCCSDGLSDL